MGMHVDSDRVVANQREEYGSYSSTSTHSSEDVVDSDHMPELMSDVE